MLGRPSRLLLFAWLLLTLETVPEHGPSRGTPPHNEHDRPRMGPVPPVQVERAVQKGDLNAVLQSFRQRTLDDKERQTLLAAIRKLGDEAFAVREQASKELTSRAGAAALLRQARHDADPEVARRAEETLPRERPDTAALVQGVRFLGEKRHVDTVPVLLAYLPWADDASVVEAIQTTLSKWAVVEGQVDERLVTALSDAEPARRAAAGVALSQAPAAAYHAAVRKLLKDREEAVRWTVAQALLVGGDRAAVPALIDLLAHRPAEDVWPLLDLLWQVGGASTPVVVPGADVESRRRCRDAWADWWQRHGDKVDLKLPAAGSASQQHTVLLTVDQRTLLGEILDVDLKGNVRRRCGEIDYPLSAELVSDNRVLLAEYRGKRLSERDFKGKILWEQTLDREVIGAQRLAGGETLVVQRKQLLKLNREGKESWRYQHPTRSIAAARQAVGGPLVLLTDEGICIYLDASGKETQRFATGVTQVLGSGFDVLANGRVVVPCLTENKVVEWSPDGQILWQMAVPQPTCVRRLPGGRTLIGSQPTREVLEVDRSGKRLWEYTAEHGVYQIDRP